MNSIAKRANLASLTLVILYALELIKSTASAGSNPPSGDSGQSYGAPIWLSSSVRGKDSERLADILNRSGPNLRASSDYLDFKDIKSNESIEAWKVLHEQSKQYAQGQVHFYRPRLEQLLRDANTSFACRESVQVVMSSMEHLDSWSVQMWSATGNFPTAGLLDGQFTDLGSYRGCVDLKIPKSDVEGENDETGGSLERTSYCIVPFRPVVPSRKPFHMIIQQHPELVNLFPETDVFNILAHKAQYFHYIYWKTGICVPHQCTPNDIQQVARLVGTRLALMAGPVKCYQRSAEPTSPESVAAEEALLSAGNQSWSKRHFQPVLIKIDEPMNRKQVIAAIVVLAFYGIVLLATIWHVLEILNQKAIRSQLERIQGPRESINGDEEKIQHEPINYGGIKYIALHYFSVITNGQEFLDTSMRPNEIKCLHGLRVFTMVWIIIVHTLQYNDWSGFTRVFENEVNLKDPLLQPIYNANYVVDNFFFMSGLLAAYTIWYANKGSAYSFSPMASLVGRYLRLTPQVLLISLLYILLPLAGNGPFWYDMSAEAGSECQRNWWINLLHIQSFYKEDEMCNIVSWWISVDMFYYALSLGLVYMILNNQRIRALLCTILFVSSCVATSAYRHYIGGYTPNNLAIVPQVGEVWSSYVVYFFWSPFPHAYPFFLGLWSGYVLANNKWRAQVRKWSRTGWTLATFSLIFVNYSSHIWMSGKVPLGSQFISTAYNNICTIVWSTAFAWIVIACHYGTATTLNNVLSVQPFVLLSKASFIIYLSHMLVVRLYFGLQNALLEVCLFTITYVIVGNIVMSIAFGVFLCITFEGPCLKFQKFAFNWVKARTSPTLSTNYANDLENFKGCKTSLAIGMGPAINTLLK